MRFGRFSLFCLGLVGVVLFLMGCLPQRGPSVAASKEATLAELALQDWKAAYPYWKQHYITFEDPQHAYVWNFDLKGVITEGQSYGMLMALWNDDAPTFDALWRWTDAHMVRTGRMLGGKRFKKNVVAEDRLYGWIADRQGNLQRNYVATDGDLQIARALLEAYERWGKDAYRQRGVELARDLWEQCTLEAHGKRLLMPGDQSNYYTNGFYAWNPGYFSPVALRLFAKYDRDHDWQKAVADNYAVLSDMSAALSQVGLPADWGGVSATRYAIVPYGNDDQGEPSYYRNEAARVFWHIAEDYFIHHAPEAKAYLMSQNFFQQQVDAGQTLTGYYSNAGAPRPKTPPEYAYAPLVVQTAVTNPAKASRYYQQHLRPMFRAAGHWGHSSPSYYRTSVITFILRAVLATPGDAKPTTSRR